MTAFRTRREFVRDIGVGAAALPFVGNLPSLGFANQSRRKQRLVVMFSPNGVIPGAFHAPRGMLEFWVDPESPYHKPVFAQDKQLVLFCAAGWRSALATKTLQDMGLQRVAHIDGGFGAWKAAGAPVADKPKK